MQYMVNMKLKILFHNIQEKIDRCVLTFRILMDLNHKNSVHMAY